jgi:hypothetical protein
MAGKLGIQVIYSRPCKGAAGESPPAMSPSLPQPSNQTNKLSARAQGPVPTFLDARFLPIYASHSAYMRHAPASSAG